MCVASSIASAETYEPPLLKLNKSIAHTLNRALRPKEIVSLEYRLQVQKSGLYRLAMDFKKGGYRGPLCQLVDAKGDIIDATRRACVLYNALSKGLYTFRVTFQHVMPNSHYLASFTEHKEWTPLMANTPVKRAFKDQFDAHFYGFQVFKKGLHLLHTSVVKFPVYVTCDLYTADGKKWASGRRDIPRSQCQLPAVLSPGEYWLKIIPTASVSTWKYQLDLLTFPHQALKQATLGRGTFQKSQQHFYTFDVDKTGLYTITTASKHKRIDPVCRLFTLRGAAIAADDNAGQQFHCRVLTPLLKGRYLLWIGRGRFSRQGPFSWEVKPLTYTSLSPQVPHVGTLRSQSNPEYFRLNITKAGPYRIETRTTNPRTNPGCHLLDAYGRRLASSYRGGRGKNCLLTHQLKPGTYWLRTFIAFHSGASAYKVSYYPLGMTFSKQGVQRHPLTLETLYKADFRHRGEIDVYSVQIKKAGSYTFETRTHYTSTDPMCYLLSQDGIILTKDDNSGPGKNCRLTFSLKPGTYFLHTGPAGWLVARSPYFVGYRRHTTPPLKTDICYDGLIDEKTPLKVTFKASKRHLLLRWNIKQAGHYRLTVEGIDQHKLYCDLYTDLHTRKHFRFLWRKGQRCEFVGYRKAGEHALKLRLPAALSTGSFKVRLSKQQPPSTRPTSRPSSAPSTP
ncbi:MAG TPA: hypothetical protein DCE42_26325 [Myxococcales bacterium]|nr:hypothetical protein [Deltaproteobacteria bacterium]MBU50741.1 hypothetical protein [Deltaproteobacteria bacterium]HAA58307.1 hypothetical protein [Myxococcales bacterium]|tara:strand:+ start:7168 stop:9195 length:2028 start_codon:yes stop_codon:yes gene_type:complete